MRKHIAFVLCLIIVFGVFVSFDIVSANAVQSEYMYCRWCGERIPSDSNYCKYCRGFVGDDTGTSTTHTYTMIPQNPASPYGKALRDNLINGVYYSDVEKVNIVTDTFYGRKDKEGNHKSWYYNTYRDDIYPKYRVELYYADGVLFFANVTKNSQNQVTLHYWGDQIVACRDLRGANDDVSYAGSAVYNAVNAEFGNLYSIALKYAPQKVC